MPPPQEKLVFEHTVEALFLKALRSRLTARLKQRLAAIGIDLDKPLKPGYEFDVWNEAIGIAAEEVFPAESVDVRTFKLGELFIAGYQETMIGKALLGMMRVLGPTRVLHRAQRSFRSGNNYTESRLREVAPNVFELWLNYVGPYPSFSAGILSAGVAAAGGKDVRVAIVTGDGRDGCTYRIEWATR